MRQEVFQYRDGTSNQIQHFADQPGTQPLLVIMPALGVRASYYPRFAERLVEEGFQVASVDWRGLGESSIRPSRKVNYSYETLVQDLREVLLHLREQYPGAPVILLGHSLGGQIGLLCAGRYPELFDGMMLVASCSVYYKSYDAKVKYQVLLGTRLFRLTNLLFGYHPGKYLGFGGREARGVIRDWCFNGLDGRYILYESDFDYEAALTKLKLPTLAVTVEGDELAPKPATEHLLGKMASDAPVQFESYTQKAAGSKLNHFSWVKQYEALIPILSGWLARYSS
ncbi:MAG: alpha/beta fold hydrolase [Bacteroidota bacterium]